MTKLKFFFLILCGCECVRVLSVYICYLSKQRKTQMKILNFIGLFVAKDCRYPLNIKIS